MCRSLGRPGGKAAVQQRRLVADGAQQPDQPGGDHAAGVVVGDDRVTVADPELRETVGEALGRRQRMTAVAVVVVRLREHRSRSTNTAPGMWPAS